MFRITSQDRLKSLQGSWEQVVPMETISSYSKASDFFSFPCPFTHWCFGLPRRFDTHLSLFSTLLPLSIIFVSFLNDQMLVSDAPIYLCRHGLSVIFTQTLLIAQSPAISLSPCHGMKYWQFTEPIITWLNKILY